MWKQYLALVCMLCLGCSSDDRVLMDETDERLYKRAKEFQIQERYEDALINYLSLIAIRRESPESHLEAGYIYLNVLKDPIRSIYYFDRYLELKPESSHSMQVRQLIETAKKVFISQIPTKPFQSNTDRVDLLEIIQKQQKELETLKKKYNQALLMIKTLQRQVGLKSSTVTSSPVLGANVLNSEIDPNSVPRTYIIKAGDSLSKISEQFYGTESRFIDILQANSDRISNERSLQIGLEIIIP